MTEAQLHLLLQTAQLVQTLINSETITNQDYNELQKAIDKTIAENLRSETEQHK